MNATKEAGTAVQNELKVLQLAEIRVSKTNPRKRFDETALKELSLSVAEYGVIQPILVRPNGDDYELVCGERRYRASLMANLTTIPANIRPLSDDEAFELQIIENLERKDVHPLDEAEAFQLMLDSGRYTIADVAAKMAKPEKFVVQRLRLNNLIPEIKQDFFDDVCNISHAVIIAKLAEEEQMEIFTGYKDKNISGYGTKKDLMKEIENKSFELTDALFSLEADYEHALACTGCAMRSINNPLLFDEFNSGDSCFKKSCYQAKTDSFIEQTVLDNILSGKNILFGRGYSGNVTAKTKEILDEYKLPLLKYNDDFYTYERHGWIKRKLFYVAGHDRGKLVDAWIPGKVAAVAGSVESPAEEIKKIEQRAVRALELDQEKIYKALVETVRVEVEKKAAINFTLDKSFATAILIYFAIDNIGFWTLRPVLKKLGIELESEYKSVEELEEAVKKVTDGQWARLIAHMILTKAGGQLSDSHLLGKMLRKLAESNSNIPVKEIEEKQKLVATARIEKTNARLDELRTKLADSDKSTKKK